MPTDASETTETQEAAFDFDAASDQIGNELGLGNTKSSPLDGGQETTTSNETVSPPPSVQTHVPVPRQVPKSWPKEMHEHWSKFDPAVHDYLEKREQQMLEGLGQYKDAATFAKNIRDVIAPYQANIRSAGVNEVQAIQKLLNADHVLRTTSPAQKAEYFKTLAQQYGVDLAGLKTDTQPVPVDPMIQNLQQELAQIKSGLSAQQHAALQEAKAHTTKEVETFWSDPAHPHAEEVADDMVPFINAGMSLQDAYDKAIWSNPVTRTKLQADTQTAWEAKQKENARLAALPKKQAAGVNVKGRDTRHAPTELLGSMEDTIRATIAEQRSRGRST